MIFSLLIRQLARPAIATSIMAVLTILPISTPAAASTLQGQHSASPPAAFHDFCRRFPAECRPANSHMNAMPMTSRNWQTLQAVNRQVNAEIREVSDRVNHGREDFWTLPMNGAGDCEDIALLKRHRLIQQGWPSSVLLMTVVRDRRGRGHAVLAAQTDRGTLILDNRTNAIRHWSDTGYTFYLIQSSRSPRQWQSINKRPTNPVTAAGEHRSRGSSRVATTIQPTSSASLFQSRFGARSLR